MKGALCVKDAREAINNRLSLYSSSTNVSLSGVKSLRRKHASDEPIAPTKNSSDRSILDCEPLSTDDSGNFVDSWGRKVVLKGINLDSAMKLPVKPNMPSYKGNCCDADDIFFDGDNVSFVGRPFPLEEAEQHFRRIKSWGYNTIRYLITWEAIEHKGPGIYDEEFLDYTIKMFQIIHRVGGLYVFPEFHQDVWSRFSGGSGAPMWTLYAAGLDPTKFAATQAALLHNESRYHTDDEETHEDYPKMIWATNYKRLASLVMFTMFFAGKNYFPHLKINGLNIQTYLQDKYLGCTGYFWKRLADGVPEMFEDGTVLGFETMNEPNCGLMGHSHLGNIPGKQQLRVGTTPTVFQSLRLGMGFPCEVDAYKIALTGPQKYGTNIIDPKGVRVWLSPEKATRIDRRYKWKRCPEWVLGECPFAQLGIWSYERVDFEEYMNADLESRLETSSFTCELLKPNYFNQFTSKHNFKMYSGVKPQKIDIEFFTNNNFIDFVVKCKKIIRSIAPNTFFLLQPPVLEVPPNLKTDPRHIIDRKTVYSPHYYDGMSLMFKTWNTKYNVDTLGIMRGRYINPVLGLVFGERAIRNCMRKQFNEIRQECEEYLGNIPILMSETGMPFDMDDKSAYENGRYYSQTSALDALSYALEGSNMSVTYWCYSSVNCHQWGDRWNNEDFSFWSPEDRDLTFEDQTSVTDLVNSTVSTTFSYIKNARARRARAAIERIKRRSSKSSSRSNSNDTDDFYKDVQESKDNDFTFNIKGLDEKEKSEEDDVSDDNSDIQSLQSSSLISWTTDNVKYRHSRKCYPSPDGVRAVGAVVRPYVIASCGDILVSEFDLSTLKFSLTISVKRNDINIKKTPTVIFVPNWHFPYLNYHDIYLTSGHVKYNSKFEYLEWYHFEDDEYLEAVSESSTLVGDGSKQETIIIKNNSGTLDNVSTDKVPDNNNCPIT